MLLAPTEEATKDNDIVGDGESLWAGVADELCDSEIEMKIDGVAVIDNGCG